MPELNLFGISGLLIAITYLPLFSLLMFKGKTKITFIYSLHILMVFFWGVGSFIISLTKDPNLALTIWKPTYIAVLLIPVFFQHSVSLLTKNCNKLYLYFVYFQAVFFTLAIFARKLFNDVQLVFDSFYFLQHTPYYIASFVIWIIIVSIAHIQLLYFYKKFYPEKKPEMLALFFAIIGFCGGLNNFLPALNIYIYPYGNFLVPTHAFFITYAIFRHQFLNINIVFRRGLVYSTLIALISLIYLITIIIFENSLQLLFDYNSVKISILIAFFLGALFFPLRNKIQNIVDKYFYKGTHDEIISQNEQLRLELTQSEKFKTLSMLSSGIAHEVKNPLTALKTFSEYLPKKLNDKKFLTKFSRIIGQEVDRINDLVHQLMDYGKPSPPALKQTNIYKLLDESTDILNSKFIDQKIKVNKIYPQKDSCIINIDRNQIKQALLNIFLNALDAMPKGGELTIATHINKKYLDISVRDSGSGIPRKDLSHIFDPFYSSKDMNTGLGLSITQTIVQQHKGNIKVKSKSGIGTEFLIKLPLN